MSLALASRMALVSTLGLKMVKSIPLALISRSCAFRTSRIVSTFEESKQMPYVTTVERAGYHRGEVDLLLWLIENKFDADTAEALRERVESADNDSLRCWSARILTADTPDAIFH